MTMTRTIKDLLRAKRDGETWTTAEIELFVHGVVHADVSSPQAAAFLMAACTRGLDARETAALTMAMTRSGARIDRGDVVGPLIDKHSTGGVGDKTSLLLVPLAVACGVHVPMISGRGLGHTGGTVDKLESIIGYRTAWDVTTLISMMQDHGYFMVGQSADIAPADKVLYALRDATGTVENVGLITASILSKKFAEGLNGLVMDMKVGRGAFMPTLEDAMTLAASLRDVCTNVGIASRFVFSRMDRPLGYAVGNLAEVLEAEAALRDVHAAAPDLVELTEALAVAMVGLAFPPLSTDEVQHLVRTAWRSGEAHRRFHEMVRLHGGDWTATLLAAGRAVEEVIVADADGYIPDIDARAVADVGMMAGVGRKTEADEVDPLAGMRFERRSGDRVRMGEVVARVTSSDPARCAAAAAMLRPLMQTTTAPGEPEPSLIITSW